MYTLGSGIRSGRVTYKDGTKVWLEYNDSTWTKSVSELDHMKRALENTVTEACISQGCNWARIMSIFHSTTRKDTGETVLDKFGLHVTVMMSYEENGKRESPDKAHIYVQGFNGRVDPAKWYDNVKVKNVRWEGDRTGSSQGTASVQGPGSTPGRSTASTPKKSASPGQTPPATDGWYPDPRKQAKLRYFQKGKWTDHVHN